MSDLPTDDVEELEAIEVDDEIDDAPVAQQTQAKKGSKSQARPAIFASDKPVHEETPRTFEFLHNVEMDVTVELGRAKRTVRDLLEVQVGSVIELDRSAGSPVDILVNGMMIARGEVVVIDDEFAVRITEVLETAGNQVIR